MPIYEYQCDACGHKFEILQKISDDLLTTCPDCNEEKLRKLVTAAAFHLKGTGWYVTDFKDKKSQSGADKGGNNSGGESKGGSETAKSTESKTANKTDTPSKPKTEAKSKTTPSSD